MRLAHKFIILILGVLVFMISSNILGLRYFTMLHFKDYLTTVQQIEAQRNNQDPPINFDLLSSFINVRNLDEKTIEEYRVIMRDLSSISNALDRFSANPRAYSPTLIQQIQKTGTGWTTEPGLFEGAITSFFSWLFRAEPLKQNSPESIFVYHVVRSMGIMNILLIVLVLTICYVWTRLVFSPIQSIIDNLSSIINKREYHTIAYNKHDEFRRLFTMINDLNKSLLIQEKIRSDFLSDLSHEIKTPITAIKCYLEGIEDGVIEIDTDTVGLLRSEIDRLIRITATVMEFEKLEQQKRGSLYVERINLETIFRAIREEYSPQLLKNNQKIIFPTIKELWISFDKDKATQLVHNVFSNFTKYAGENAVLTIQHQHHKTDTEIIFSDNGIGVSSSEIPFLKEKFYRADKSRSDGDKQGIGIGLSVIEKIIQLHGGEWKIESEQWAWFRITLKIPR